MVAMMIFRTQGLLPARPRNYDLTRHSTRGRGGERMSLLDVQRLTKSFGGLTAVNNVSFNVEAGHRGGTHRSQRGREDDGFQPDHRDLSGPISGAILLQSQRLSCGFPLTASSPWALPGPFRPFDSFRISRFWKMCWQGAIVGCNPESLAAMLHTPRPTERGTAGARCRPLQALEFVGLRASGRAVGQESFLRQPAAAGNRPGPRHGTASADPG